MKINANSLRVGQVIRYKEKLFVVVKTQHTQPGKGGAYIQAELKGLLETTKLNERFRSSETLEKVYLEELDHQYLYQEGDFFVFMNQETYDQISLEADVIGDQAKFLQDGMVVSLCFYEEKPISMKLPDTVVLEVTEADAVVKGQTATSSFKPALMENGMRIQVPQHIETGMRIVVNTEDSTYVERAKS